jgi:hypothetical protein
MTGTPHLLRWVAVLVACVQAAAPAQATVLLPADFTEMATASAVIVRGEIVDVRGQVTGDRRTIESLVTLRVDEAIKGRPGTTVVFRVPGGQVGRYRRVMIGAPVFTPGDAVIVFLRGDAPAIPVPYGLSQGVYRVARDADGRLVVAPPVTAPGLTAARVVRGDPARAPIAADAFTARVRAALETAR